MKISKLTPATKSYIWGGTRLKTDFGKITDADTLAETWELSFHPDGLTLLCDGTPLCDTVTKKDLGKNVEAFPQLIKLIDAHDDLSLQVHPSDDYALVHENSCGKTEMWYIVDANEGAGIYLGFKRDVTKEEFEAAIDNNTLTELLNFFPVKKGECYFIPAGTLHAIGKGCLICEVQQNSNITYRVYDYGRRDKDGKLRELHVQKAKAVADLKRFEYDPLTGDTIARSKYFDVKKYELDGDMTLTADDGSFVYAVALSGEGNIGGIQVRAGDSVFIPAGTGDVTLLGKMTVLTSCVRKYYVGIDLGGTFIKGGIVDDLGNIIVSDKVPSEAENGHTHVINNIARLCFSLCRAAHITPSDCVGIGVAIPGTVDSTAGTVLYSNNIRWQNVEVAQTLERLVGLPVRIANDANTAALGEALFGSGSEYKTTVMLTLGTGVGGGVVIDGRLYDGNRGAGAEMGHAVILAGGEQCTCGRRGCLEAYASASALIRDTKRAMERDKHSKMWQDADIDGATAFKYMNVDTTAKKVVDNYITMLACGITNLANEFRPEAVILGGGVCNEGERLISPLQEILDKEIFGAGHGPRVKIITATLGNRAGTLGAAALWIR